MVGDNMSVKDINNADGTGKKTTFKVRKYQAKAESFNRELDNTCSLLNEYKVELDDIDKLLKENFNNEGSYVIGMENVITKINAQIEKYKNSINAMKQSSMVAAKNRDAMLESRKMEY